MNLYSSLLAIVCIFRIKSVNRARACFSGLRRCAPLVAGLFVLLAAAGCGPRPVAVDDQPVPIGVRTPHLLRQHEQVAASGELEASITSLCAFQQGGRVARVLVDEGQAVRQGQLLAELDPADYKNALDAAEGQAEAALAQQSKAQAGLRAQELEQARVDYEQQLDQYKRMRFLWEQKSLAANDFNRIEAAYKAAEQRYQMARQGTRTEDKTAASGQWRAAAAQAAEARKRWSDTRLLAPIAGLVGMKKVEVGNSVAAGTPVFSVLALDLMKVRVAVPESEISKVQNGAAAHVVIPALGGEVFEGTVDAVGVAADAASRTYTVKVAVANPAHRLKAGMVAEVRIVAYPMVDVLTLPAEAIVHDARGVTLVFVYNAAQGRVAARRVAIGAPMSREVEISAGLKADDRVVTAGQLNLRDGARVQLAGGGQ